MTWRDDVARATSEQRARLRRRLRVLLLVTLAMLLAGVACLVLGIWVDWRFALTAVVIGGFAGALIVVYSPLTEELSRYDRG